eukprot:2826551-Heterocapsa_arctica.AAC.1
MGGGPVDLLSSSLGAQYTRGTRCNPGPRNHHPFSLPTIMNLACLAAEHADFATVGPPEQTRPCT